MEDQRNTKNRFTKPKMIHRMKQKLLHWTMFRCFLVYDIHHLSVCSFLLRNKTDSEKQEAKEKSQQVLCLVKENRRYPTTIKSEAQYRNGHIERRIERRILPHNERRIENI